MEIKAKCDLDEVDDFKPTWVDLPMLFSAYPVYGLSAREVNCFASGVQVFSFHCRTVVFHPLEKFSVPLDVFSGLASSSFL